MVFDSGVAQEAWDFVIAVCSYPVWPVGFSIAAWIAYALKRDRLSAILTTLIFLHVPVLIIVLVSASFFHSLGG